MSKYELIDGTVIAQKALSAVSRLNQSFGMNYTIDFLRGSKSEKLREEHKLLKTYGVGADISKEEWQTYFRDLIARGFLQQSEGEYPVIRLTDRSEDVLRGRKKVELVKTKTIEVTRIAKGTGAETSYQKELYNELKELRKTIADSANVPAYVILSDATLIEMAAYLPQTADELRRISGFGDVKLQRYGREFLQCVTDYCRRKNLSSRINEKSTKRERKSQRPIKTDEGYKSTYQITLDMYKQGLSFAEIAERRQVTTFTVENHLAHFVEKGELFVEDFVPREKIILIRDLIERFGYQQLKTIKENATEDVTYNDIRFVVSSVLAGKR